MARSLTGPTRASPQCLLIVEGSDDLHVLRHLCDRHSSSPNFCIENKGNDIRLLESIVPESRVEDRKALGIMIDANDTLSSRWDALSDRLRRVGIQTPAAPESHGTVISTPDKPKIGIWLMPDNCSPGELEDFIAQMIPTNDPVWPLSTRYVDGIPIRDRKFKEGKVLRARIHAWLAVRAEPRPMGRAITTQDLDIDGDLCQRFTAWITRLFG